MSKLKKPYFPMFVDLSEKNIFVIGAGTIAKRRIRSLMEFTENLTVIAPEVNSELKALENKGIIRILRKKYCSEDIADAYMVIAATNEHQTNIDIYHYCKDHGILVNVCSDKHMCDFYFPGIAKKDNIVVGVTASGANHKQAKNVVERIRELFA